MVAKVFISYQRDDEPVVTLLAGALSQSGHTVWWDRGIGADEEWRKQIQEQIIANDVILTIWTRRSLESRWVWSEADEADKGRKLIQATLDGTLPPKPFDRLQCLDLLAWNGDAADPRLAPVREAIDRVAMRGAGGGPASDRPLPTNTGAERSWMLIHDSLEPESYRAFLEKHGNSPQANFARKNLEQLEIFRQLDRSDPQQISDFIYLGPFMALGAVAKEAHAYALENGPAMRFRDHLPPHIDGHVLKGSKIENGSLSADYELPNLKREYQARFDAADKEPVFSSANYARKQAGRWMSAGSFHIDMSRFRHRDPGAWVQWWRDFAAENDLESVVSVETLNDLPVLVRKGLKLIPDFIDLAVLIGEKYVLSVSGNKPVEEIRRLLRSFDFEKVHQVCEGIAKIGGGEIPTIMRSPEVRGGTAAEGPGESRRHRGGGAAPVQRSRGGVARAIVLGTVLAVIAVGVFVYIDQGSPRFWETWASNPEPTFVVEPFQSAQVLLARDDGSNYRAEPFATDDVAVLAQTVAGETLSTTGIVHQLDGDWYQVQLRDGRVAYLKGSLVVVRTPEPATVSEGTRDEQTLDPDLRPPGTGEFEGESATQDRDSETLNAGDLY